MKTLNALVISTLVTALTLGADARADQPAVHGMLLFGQKTVYASHLPMLHAPHDYQLILSLTLADTPSGGTLKAYEAAKNSGHSLFTLVPEVMDLSRVISGAKKSFSAVVYQGHFEQGGIPLGPVDVQVTEILYASKLAVGAAEPESYLEFGGQGEYYAAHLIHPAVGTVSFDSIMHVSAPYQLTYVVCHGRVECPEPAQQPLGDSSLPLTLSGGSPKAGGQLGQLRGPLSDVLDVVYYNESDLVP